MLTDKTGQSARFPIATTLAAAAMGLAMLYLLVRIAVFILSDYPWFDKLLAFFLLLAEIFILVHGVGYFLEIVHVATHRRSPADSDQSPPRLVDHPPVAIIVSSFKEPLDVIEATLISFYNLSYPEKHLYFLRSEERRVG